MIRPLAIHKFGGTSLGDAARIEAAAEILRAASRRERVVAVVSATAGTTDALLAAARDAQRGRTSSWRASVAGLRDRHLALAERFEGRKGRASAVGQTSGLASRAGVSSRAGRRSPAAPGRHGGATFLVIEALLEELETALSGISLLRELSDRSLDAVGMSRSSPPWTTSVVSDRPSAAARTRACSVIASAPRRVVVRW